MPRRFSIDRARRHFGTGLPGLTLKILMMDEGSRHAIVKNGDYRMRTPGPCLVGKIFGEM
jgi:hypothetical protein